MVFGVTSDLGRGGQAQVFSFGGRGFGTGSVTTEGCQSRAAHILVIPSFFFHSFLSFHQQVLLE